MTILVDSLVILIYFVVVISIGLYKGRGDKSMQGFAIGDRNIPWWAVLASILAAEISAGADDESEMGAFHDLYQPQRAANLRARLNEYIPADVNADVILAS